MDLPDWTGADDYLLTAAERYLDKHARDEASVRAYFAEKAPLLLDAARRFFARHFDRTNSHRLTPRGVTYAKTMRRALELLHGPGVRDHDGVLSFLVRAARDMDCRAGAADDLATTTEGCLALAVERSSRTLDRAARRALAEASAREDAYLFGNRLVMALYSFPDGADAYLDLLSTATFENVEGPEKHLRWLLHFQGDPPFDRAVSTLLSRLDPTQRSTLYGRLEEWPEAVSLLPVLAEQAARYPDPSHTALARLCRRLGRPAAEPLLIYLVLHGHRRALGAAVEALAELGTHASREALELACTTWDRDVADKARDVLAQLDTRAVQPTSTEPAEAIRRRLAGHECPTGWTFQERQLLDLCAQTAVDNATARARFEPADGDRLLALARRHWERDAGPETTAAPTRAFTDLITVTWVLGRPPLATHPETLPLVLDMLDRSHEVAIRANARLTLIDQIEAGLLALDPAAQRRVAAQLDDPLWDAERRYELATLALPASLEDWLHLFAGRTSPDTLPEREHRWLCRLPAGDGTRRALTALYGACDEPQRRGLIAQIPTSADPEYLPVWLTLAREASPTTRLALVETLVRLGHPAAEAFVQVVSRDETDPAVRRAAVEGLGKLGTRTSLELLHQLRSAGGGLRPTVEAAIDRIAERFPEDAIAGARGALSLDDDAQRGALALAPAAGSLTVDDPRAADVPEAAAATRPAPTPAPATSRSLQPTSRLDWVGALPAPPRRVPATVRLALLLGANRRWGVTWWLLASLLVFMVHAKGDFNWLHGLGFAGVAWGFVEQHRKAHTRRTLRVLRWGRPATARLKQRKRATIGSGDSAVTVHRYEFELLAEDGRTHAATVDRKKPDASLSDEPREPALYTLDDSGKVDAIEILDAVRAVRVNRRGHLCVRLLALGRALFGPALLAFLIGTVLSG